MDLHERSLVLMRFALGIVFIWFGVLKLFSVSAVQGMIRLALPAFLSQSQPFWLALSLLEIFIGVGFFLPRLVKLTSVVMLGHLLIATITVLLTQGFSPRFPVLSLEGEFVIKNLVLMTSGLVLLAHQRAEYDTAKPEHTG